MSPDAAGIVATVDAALLIALTVDANSQKQKENPGRKATEPGRDGTPDGHEVLRSLMAWLYIIGIFGVVVSLSMTLSSVEITKPMTGYAQHVAVDAAAAGFFPLVLGTVRRFLPDLIASLRNYYSCNNSGSSYMVAILGSFVCARHISWMRI